MVIYFSGTGNSRYCAEKIAKALDDEFINAADYIKHGKAGNFASQKPWVFAVPTYAWQVPHIFESFLKTATFSGTEDAYFIMTCGGDIGNASVHNKKLCDEAGLNYMGTLEVVMPENYIAMFEVPDEEESEKIVAEALPVLEKGIEAITQRKSLPERKVSLADKMKSGIVNTAFYALFVKSKAFYASDDCVACGKCEKVCPTNCVTLKNGKPVWGEGCTHCMACICLCPAKAIEYGKNSVGKRRYLCNT
ncbi:MAG: EFR1 family ferrodoxin [Clostridia bacterium]|nr:EFR1 family ferrodoxin [Clostridia bacterium]